MDPNVQEFVTAKRIAVMGVSRKKEKFGNTIYTELKARGYEVAMIHPEAVEINGERCYPNLAALQGNVDGVVICVSPQKAEAALREAVQNGVKNIWLQQGAESPAALGAARELGVQPVTGKCILMYAQPVTGLHRWHRGFVRLVGQL